MRTWLSAAAIVISEGMRVQEFRDVTLTKTNFGDLIIK